LQQVKSREASIIFGTLEFEVGESILYNQTNFVQSFCLIITPNYLSCTIWTKANYNKVRKHISSDKRKLLCPNLHRLK